LGLTTVNEAIKLCGMDMNAVKTKAMIFNKSTPRLKSTRP